MTDAVWLRDDIGEAFLEKVTAQLNHGPGAWDMENPRDIIAAVLNAEATKLRSQHAEIERLKRIEAAARNVVGNAGFATHHGGTQHLVDAELMSNLRAALAQPERDATAEECEQMEGK